MNQITLTLPDDFHLHVRDGDVLPQVLSHTASQFRRALIMPNLRPPVTTVASALAYQERIKDALKVATQQGALTATNNFQALMSLYLTDQTPSSEILLAKDKGVLAVKLYPAGATTNSDSGVTDIRLCDDSLDTMAQVGMPLLVHGEVTHSAIDIFDREAKFIEEVLHPLRLRHPKLKVVFEHITTKDAMEYVRDAEVSELGPIAATITAHHLMYNRNALFTGGIRPHYYCLPILKREAHRLALLDAATSDSSRFFLGTDSAPHAKDLKEHTCGCAGCYTASHALELYATAFDSVGKLRQLEAFASFRGADFYQIPRNHGQITLQRQQQQVPNHYAFGNDLLVPLNAGEVLNWSIVR
jgi:dihydroorotase